MIRHTTRTSKEQIKNLSLNLLRLARQLMQGWDTVYDKNWNSLKICFKSHSLQERLLIEFIFNKTVDAGTRDISIRTYSQIMNYKLPPNKWKSLNYQLPATFHCYLNISLWCWCSWLYINFSMFSWPTVHVYIIVFPQFVFFEGVNRWWAAKNGSKSSAIILDKCFIHAVAIFFIIIFFYFLFGNHNLYYSSEEN